MVVLVTCKNKNESVNSDIIMLPYSLGLVTNFSTKIELPNDLNDLKMLLIDPHHM